MLLVLHRCDADWEWFLSLRVGKAKNKAQMFHLLYKCQFSKTLLQLRSLKLSYLSNDLYAKLEYFNYSYGRNLDIDNNETTVQTQISSTLYKTMHSFVLALSVT
jgi:hypothetical protein